MQIQPDKNKTYDNLIRKELNPDTFSDVEVRYLADTTRQVKRITEIISDRAANNTFVKQGGVYWITGGLGGLGRIFTHHLGHGNNATIILSGRSRPDETKLAVLDDIKETGIHVHYIQCDVTQKTGVKKAYEQIKTEYGALNGIIHSAGVIQDALIVNKTAEEIDRVLMPKVAGLIHIDAVTRNEPLDFMVLFSSVAGIVGNIGQCDYSTANAFLDNYAGYRHDLFQTGKRFGKTISINWPLWKDGGMLMDETAQKLIARRTGIMPLATSAGLDAFDCLLAQTGHPGAIIAAGKADKILNTLGLTTALSTARQTIDAKPSSDTNPVFQKQVEEDLIDLCVDLLKVEKTDIDKETEFSEYGVDSILLMQMLEKLEEKYKQTVEAAVILEHAAITTLARHLIDQGIAKAALPAGKESASKTAPSLSQQSVAPGFVPELISEKGTRFGYVAPDSSGKRKIAVIGQACRLPQSSTIEQFWSNLAAGRDLISTVPPDRWDPKMFYSEDRSDPNKAYTNHGGFIDDIGYFDAGFFKIQDHEALTMDPQQRIILELTQALFDDAGYEKGDVNETKTGIYIGAKDNGYT
ncbi:MAG: SDR family NAD(P)-dependent oxidoreductase, partial [bacterium]|nr:SDR family NAD(P)-dependent oxidoreductase [bacterium]